MTDAPADWSWVGRLASGGEPTDPDRAALGLDQAWSSQGAAESWLGEHYPELADHGIEAVTLLHAGQVVYGPMSLDEPIA